MDGATAEVTHLVPAARPDAALFEALGSAVARRKVLRFQYHAMSTDRTERRTVEPYGSSSSGASGISWGAMPIGMRCGISVSRE